MRGSYAESGEWVQPLQNPQIEGRFTRPRCDISSSKYTVGEKGYPQMLKVLRSLFVFLGSLVLLNLPCCAQQTLGAINGTVTDSSGAVVAKATVKVRNTGTNLEHTATPTDNASSS